MGRVGGTQPKPLTNSNTLALSRREGRSREYNLYFSLNPSPKPEPSGSHSRGRESHRRKIPGLPLFTLLKTIPICYYRSCFFRRVFEFPERKMSEVSPPRILLGHLSLYVGTGLFLFGLGKIELPLPGFELTTLNSVQIFSLFGSNLATSGSPKSSKFKIHP